MEKQIKFCDFASVLDKGLFVTVKGSVTKDSDWFEIYEGKIGAIPKNKLKMISEYCVEWSSIEVFMPSNFDEEGYGVIQAGLAIKLKNTPKSLAW